MPSNLIVPNNLTVLGNLTALGTSTFQNTVFTTTSALSVVNLGPGPALYVYQAAGPYDVASFYDGDGVEVLHVGNAQGGGNTLGQVGINTSFPSAELTVNGAISSNGAITVFGGNSNQWNSNYSTTQSNSANWILQNGNSFGGSMVIGTNDSYSVSVRTNGVQRLLITNTNHRFNGNVSIGTGVDSSERLTVNGNISATGVIYVSGGNSNQWNSNYSTTQSNSANWSDVYTTVRNFSASWEESTDIGAVADRVTNIQQITGSWQRTYTDVSTNSANWNTAYTNLVSNSSNYLSGASVSYVNTNFVKISGDVMTGGLSATGLSSAFVQIFNKDVGAPALNPKLFIYDNSGIGYPELFTVQAADASDPLLRFKRTASNAGNYVFMVRGAPGATWMSINDNSYFDQQLIIHSNGNVGISQTVPTTKLHVNGVITASGGNSNQWNSNYSTTQSNSANWSDVYTTVRNFSASWEESTDIGAVADRVTNIQQVTGSWQRTYTNVSTNSATWSNWQSVSALYAVGTQYVKLSGDTMTGSLSTVGLSAGNIYSTGIIRGTGGFTIAGAISGNNLTTSFGQGSATGAYSFAVGIGSRAFGIGSHAEGSDTIASGDSSHAEGASTTASGVYSHAEGANNIALGIGSHAEGIYTVALGTGSHAEGVNNTASGPYSHAEGGFNATGRKNNFLTYTAATKTFTFASAVSGNFSYVSPGTTIRGEEDNVLDDFFTITVASRNLSNGNIIATADVIGGDSTEGYLIDGSGTYSHAEGNGNIASGPYSHAEGVNNIASGIYSHAEGVVNTASGQYSHAEGVNNTASGDGSHAEGVNNIASGQYSHAAGQYAQAAHQRTWVWHGSTVSQSVCSTRTNQFMVSAAGGVYIPGNVGIGTDNNSNALTVVGTVSTNAHKTSQDWASNWTTTNTNSAAWSNWQSVSGNYALGSQYVKLSGDTMTGSLTVVGDISATGTIYSSTTAKAIATYIANIGNGVGTSFNLPHNLNTLEIITSVYDNTTNVQAYPTVTVVDANTVNVQFSFTPSANAYRVVIVAATSTNLIAAYGGLTTTAVEKYQFRSSDFSITSSAYFAVDTTSGPVRATLPAAPSLGDTVIFIDTYKTWTANNLVLQRNGNVIESLAEDLSANISGFTFKATWVGAPAGWRIY